MSRPTKKPEVRQTMGLADCFATLGKTHKKPSVAKLPPDFPEPVYYDGKPRFFVDEVAEYQAKKADARPSARRAKGKAAANTPNATE